MNNKVSVKDLRFGTELEVEGISYENAARAILAIVGGQMSGYGSSWTVTQDDGRKWSVVYDGSVQDGCEVVSPILTWTDMDALQSIVRELRARGARATDKCGQHVHVDGARFQAAPGKLSTLVGLVARYEGLVTEALGILSERARFCKTLPSALVDAFRGVRSLRGAQTAWYTNTGDVYGRQDRASKYHNSRYHGVNLHSFFYRGTVEFRWFNGTVHAGQVKANVLLALGLVAEALNTRNVARRPAAQANGKRWTMQRFLQKVLKGNEFRAYRKLLAKNLPGQARPTRPEAPAPAVTSGEADVVDVSGQCTCSACQRQRGAVA